jgi:signal peptide peptidase SppA
MKYPHIAARLHHEPWLIRSEEFQHLAQGFSDAVAQKFLPENAADTPVGPRRESVWGEDAAGMAHPQIQIHQGLALATVHGTTGRGLSALAMQCGGYDTGLFREQLQHIAEDDSIKALVIDFRTPGGMASGNMAVAKDIRSVADSGKRVYGYSEFMCCSAGYFMAAACDEFHAHPDAIVGSISTIYSGIDSSQAFAMNGLKLELFATGKFKATGMAGKEWTDEERQNIWGRIQPIDTEFKGFVKSRRSLAPEDMEGQWWYAKAAPAAVVDSTDFESLAEFIQSIYATF